MAKPDNLPSAAEPSAQEIEQRRDQASALHGEIKNRLADTSEAAWRLAESLYRFDEILGWKVLGYETHGEWLADPEIGITKNVYYRLVRCYRTLVVERSIEVHALSQLDPSKVEIVVPAIEQGARSTDSALADVRELGWRDLREKYVLGPRREREQARPSLPVPDEAHEEPEPEPDEGEADDDDVEVVDGEYVSPAAYAGALDDRLAEWHSLLAELAEARDSGGSQPRVAGRLIGPGLEALKVLIQAGVSADTVMEVM